MLFRSPLAGVPSRYLARLDPPFFNATVTAIEELDRKSKTWSGELDWRFALDLMWEPLWKLTLKMTKSPRSLDLEYRLIRNPLLGRILFFDEPGAAPAPRPPGGGELAGSRGCGLDFLFDGPGTVPAHRP